MEALKKDDKIRIVLEDWEHTCADGCCTSYGTRLYLNGKELEHPYSTEEDYIDNGDVGGSVELTLIAVLKELGYTDVEIQE